jgi:prepilin signal peptidase PulO-like enzyme (type II secretory pathway)
MGGMASSAALLLHRIASHLQYYCTYYCTYYLLYLLLDDYRHPAFQGRGRMPRAWRRRSRSGTLRTGLAWFLLLPCARPGASRHYCMTCLLAYIGTFTYMLLLTYFYLPTFYLPTNLPTCYYEQPRSPLHSASVNTDLRFPRAASGVKPGIGVSAHHKQIFPVSFGDVKH